MKEKLFEILVPSCFNDGRPIKASYHRVWDKKIKEYSNGMTICKSVNGKWYHKDDVFKERMIPVRIICSDDNIKEIVKFTADYYEQLAILAYEVSDNVVMFEADNEMKSSWKEKNKCGMLDYSWIN